MVSHLEQLSDMVKDLQEKEQAIKANSDKIQKLHQKILGLIAVVDTDPKAREKLGKLFSAFPGGLFNEYKKIDKQAVQISKGLKLLYKQFEKANKLAGREMKKPVVLPPTPAAKKSVKAKKVRSYL